MASGEDDGRDGGWSPLLTAAEAGRLEAAAAAIAAGADVNAADADGWTPLQLAALNDRTAVVAMLLAQPGIDANRGNRWKSTPLMLAASRGNVAAVRLLAERDDARLDARAEYYGRTPLIEAARNGHAEVVALLLAKGADVNVRDKTGRNTALIEAIKNRREDVARLLLDTGRIDFADRDARLSALVWAGSVGDPALREALQAAVRGFFERDAAAAPAG